MCHIGSRNENGSGAGLPSWFPKRSDDEATGKRRASDDEATGKRRASDECHIGPRRAQAVPSGALLILTVPESIQQCPTVPRRCPDVVHECPVVPKWCPRMPSSTQEVPISTHTVPKRFRRCPRVPTLCPLRKSNHTVPTPYPQRTHSVPTRVPTPYPLRAHKSTHNSYSQCWSHQPEKEPATSALARQGAWPPSLDFPGSQGGTYPSLG